MNEALKYITLVVMYIGREEDLSTAHFEGFGMNLHTSAKKNTDTFDQTRWVLNG